MHKFGIRPRELRSLSMPFWLSFTRDNSIHRKSVPCKLQWWNLCMGSETPTLGFTEIPSFEGDSLRQRCTRRAVLVIYRLLHGLSDLCNDIILLDVVLN